MMYYKALILPDCQEEPRKLRYTLSNIMEDARDNNKELWIAFQDMAKAFDSVSMTSLQMACRRIKLPEDLTNLFINMFDERKISIITEFGLSDPLTAATGIDQGEVVSPLLWRIFYDPLLSQIQQDVNFGYNML